MKKSSAQKAKVALVAYSAATAIAGLVVAENANAASTACGTQGTSTAPVQCAIGVSGPLAVAVNFTGSNDVSIFYDASSSTDFAVCAYHNKGNNSYGYTLGGKVNTKTSTGGAATLGTGCN